MGKTGNLAVMIEARTGVHDGADSDSRLGSNDRARADDGAGFDNRGAGNRRQRVAKRRKHFSHPDQVLLEVPPAPVVADGDDDCIMRNRRKQRPATPDEDPADRRPVRAGGIVENGDDLHRFTRLRLRLNQIDQHAAVAASADDYDARSRRSHVDRGVMLWRRSSA